MGFGGELLLLVWSTYGLLSKFSVYIYCFCYLQHLSLYFLWLQHFSLAFEVGFFLNTGWNFF